jgi:transcriptional regulator with XRE-family HTH domain
MAKSVGEVLRAMREDADLSRSAVARRAKMEPNALLRVETGGSPSFEMVWRVARALGVSLDAVAAAAFGKGARPKAQVSDAITEEALVRLASVLGDASEIVVALREGRSVSPPRRRRR